MSHTDNAAIVIPCFNEGARLPAYLSEIVTTLSSFSAIPAHILIAEDGSNPEQAALIGAAISSAAIPAPHTVDHCVFPVNRGKGAVLCETFLELRKSYAFVGFCDADGATPFAEVLRILQVLRSRPELSAVIGSRWKALGHPVDRTLKRHLSGRIFATLLSNLFDIPVYDSQCGAKFFRSQFLTDSLLAHCTDRRWLFDTQLLIALFASGAPLLEEPVAWHDTPGSKVSLLRDSIRMACGLLKLKFSRQKEDSTMRPHRPY